MRLSLPNVTLVAVTSVAMEATARAVAISQRGIDFGAVLFLSDQPPPEQTPAVWRKISPIRSRIEYSQFMLQDLSKHFHTDYALCIQWDGYVLNHAVWDPTFFDYDYIGSPWPHFSDGMCVGNGGFSLRSKRLVDACAAIPISAEAEDVSICRTHRAKLEKCFGLRFAPPAVAQRFAYERLAPHGHEFGFHGAFNMINLMPPSEWGALFEALEPNLLNRNEHRELFYKMIRRGNFCNAWIVLKRMRDGVRR